MCRWVIYMAIKLLSLLLSSLPFLVVDWSQEHRSILLDIGIGDNYKNKENGVKGFCFRRGWGNRKNWYTYGINDTNLIHCCCNLLRSLFDQFQTGVSLAGWDVGHRLSAFRLTHFFQKKKQLISMGYFQYVIQQQPNIFLQIFGKLPGFHFLL